jgi:ankyrin repeat protein
MPMRLLQRQSDGHFQLTKPFLDENTPPYAILSHTWLQDSEEVTYEDLSGNSGLGKAGYKKIKFCAEQAAKDGLTHFWVDSCCIRKSSDAELSEAINSMFKWYRRAAKCYVYLSDISTLDGYTQQESAFRGSRWFTRGWTLQELLAPKSVEFFSKEGQRLGDKKSFERIINEITGIPLSALAGAPLSQFTVEERMRWAKGRTTTRKEDRAYCLLGIFEIFISPIYGEEEHAFVRLKEAIHSRTTESKEDFVEPASKRRKMHSDILGIDRSPDLVTKECLLDSLRFDQIDDRFVNIKPGLAKTCRWLLQSPEYLDWLDPEKLSDHHGFLWIKGKPGCGKSTLTKFAFMEAKKVHRDTTLLSFFFNARGTGLEKSTIGLYRSLLAQLVDKCTGYEEALHFPSVSNQVLDDRLKTNRKMLEHLFRQAVLVIDQQDIMIVIDALDECDEDEVREMVEFFENLGEDALCNSRKFRVLFSSRHYPHIEIQPCIEMVLENQQGHFQDIERYLSGKLKAGKGKQAQEIKRDIHKRASGIFMWVVLVVQILNKASAHGQAHVLRKKLQEIPDDLNELFRRILTRDRQNMDQMKLCLQWVLYAKRPMKREELYFAILSGIEPEGPFLWDSDDISIETMDRFILSSSKGLAEVTKSKASTVQFIHESVRDYLLKENGLRQLWNDLKINTAGLSHDRLKECCLNYIKADINTHFATQKPRTPQIRSNAADVRERISRKFPFLVYTTENILYHADTAQAEGVSQDRFLQEFEFQSWIDLKNAIKSPRVRRLPQQISLLCALTEQSHLNLISISSTDELRPSFRTGYYGNPIFTAMINDNFETLEALINRYRQTNPDRCRVHRFPYPTNDICHLLIAPGKPGLVHRFLSIYREDLDLGQENGRMLLSWAVEQGHESVAKLLLASNNDFNPHHEEYGKILRMASAQGQKQMVMLLLEKGVDVNAHDDILVTPLHAASENSHEQVVKLLLERNADVSADDGGPHGSALQAALNSRLTESSKIGKLLLDSGANIHAEGGRCCDALQAACATGKLEFVKVLLDMGADVNMQGGHYGNALQVAICSGCCNSMKIVKLLLDNGADIHAQGGFYGNALQAASYSGEVELLKLLLDMGADANAQGGEYHTSLQAAAVCGTRGAKIVKLLLQKGADISAQDGFFGNALQAASGHGNAEVVSLLLAKGININSQGGYYGNALQAASVGHERIVKLLLDKGANINAQGGYYGNALQAASARGHERIVKLLLDNGASINAQGGSYDNALNAAVACGAKDIKKLLVRRGAKA